MIDAQGRPLLHPFCNTCGWRKGGLDSWNGRACKCRLWEPPMPSIDTVCVDTGGNRPHNAAVDNKTKGNSYER